MTPLNPKKLTAVEPNKRILRLKKLLTDLQNQKSEKKKYIVTSGLKNVSYFKTEQEAMEFILKKTYTPYSGWNNIKEAYFYCYVDSDQFFNDDYVLTTINEEITWVTQEIEDEEDFNKLFNLPQ